MGRTGKVMASSLLILVMFVALLLPVSFIEGAVKPPDTMEFRFDPVALLESYLAGEHIISTIIVDEGVVATVDGDTRVLGTYTAVVDGVVQSEVVQASLVTDNQGRSSLEWSYESYKRRITLRKGELQDKFTLNDQSGAAVDLIYNSKTYKLRDELEVSHDIGLTDSSYLVWMKDLILWTESAGYKWVSFYFDQRLIPPDLTDEELVDYWDELRHVSQEQFASVIDGQKNYDLMAETYVGAPKLVSKIVLVETFGELTGEVITEEIIEWELENYMIMGVYNSDPSGLRSK